MKTPLPEKPLCMKDFVFFHNPASVLELSKSSWPSPLFWRVSTYCPGWKRLSIKTATTIILYIVHCLSLAFLHPFEPFRRSLENMNLKGGKRAGGWGGGKVEKGIKNSHSLQNDKKNFILHERTVPSIRELNYPINTPDHDTCIRQRQRDKEPFNAWVCPLGWWCSVAVVFPYKEVIICCCGGEEDKAEDLKG